MTTPGEQPAAGSAMPAAPAAVTPDAQLSDGVPDGGATSDRTGAAKRAPRKPSPRTTPTAAAPAGDDGTPAGRPDPADAGAPERQAAGDQEPPPSDQRDPGPAETATEEIAPKDDSATDDATDGDTTNDGDDDDATDGDATNGDGAEDGTGAGSPTAAEHDPAPTREDDLTTALRGLRDAIATTAYPLRLPSAEDARRVGPALVGQLDDYLLPRLARLDAPLLVVIGGSTGAGKSTLVNSLVQAPVSASGVLRPTTRAPVLVCHPNDNPWFRQGDLLPGLTRTAKSSGDPHTLQLVAAPALTPGLAFLDAPDIDSVVDANRALAAQLLAAADLWLFVTTAARYADAVPWELLRTARLRGTVTALVLDRVPPDAQDEIADHLRQMLAVHDLASAPLFVLPEATVDGQGLLPEPLIAPLREWFGRLAADATAR
ncbi:MAG TPA: hypothetical protein VES42_07520, partial [Pilimelia sp.]|nr:hypothetical protein [Pilimelia sp.]